MYQPEPATEKQFKYFVYLCKGIKNMSAPRMGRIQDYITKRYKLFRFSDINKDQMIIAIDMITRHYNGSFKKFVINSSYNL